MMNRIEIARQYVDELLRQRQDIVAVWVGGSVARGEETALSDIDLQLMAAGLSNQEIADRLIITLGTVKSHANHIFAKLGVQGRVKAINRARELALI